MSAKEGEGREGSPADGKEEGSRTLSYSVRGAVEGMGICKGSDGDGKQVSSTPLHQRSHRNVR